MKTLCRKIFRQIPLLFVGVATLILWSCEQKELYPDLSPLKVRVDFDWNNAEGASPEGMTILFFPADGYSKEWRFDIEGRSGGEIEILPGLYHVLAYNSDLPGVNFIRIDSYDKYAGEVRNISDSICASTGILYSAHIDDVSLGIGSDNTQRLILLPDSLSVVYNVRLDSVSGSERIKTATAIVKGLARSVCLQSQRNSKETCSISAPLLLSREDRSVLQATATGFGNPDISDPRITLEVIITTAYGSYRKEVDVTGQVMESKNPRNVFIHISGLRIPAADDPSNPDGSPDVGIGVGVDGWRVIEIIYS